MRAYRSLLFRSPCQRIILGIMAAAWRHVLSYPANIRQAHLFGGRVALIAGAPAAARRPHLSQLLLTSHQINIPTRGAFTAATDSIPEAPQVPGCLRSCRKSLFAPPGGPDLTPAPCTRLSLISREMMQGAKPCGGGCMEITHGDDQM